jgi:diguanylate cyclase (GGDEF)-like protein/PAS domain S-box-containing protein
MSAAAEENLIGKQRLNLPYMRLLIAVGAGVCLFSAYRLDTSRLDLQLLLLAAFTATIGSRIGIQIPKTKAEITVSDTFVFLTLLLYGGEAAILLAAVEALCSSLRFSKRWTTRLFNASLLACSTFTTVWILRLCFGQITKLVPGAYRKEFILAIFLMALTQYGVNSGLAALRDSLKLNRPFWRLWHDHYLWTSITYLAGASAAAIVAELAGSFGLYAFIVSVPIIGIIYFTYSTYRNSLVSAENYAKEQQRVNHALQESEEHFRNAFDHAAGMALIAPDGHWLQVNKSLCEILGYSEQELLATNYQSVTHREDLSQGLLHVYDLLEGKTAVSQSEKRYVHKLGRDVWVLESASVVRGRDGAPRHLIFQIQDVTERKRAEQQVRHAAFHDTLTNLPNRALLADRLSLALARARRNPDYQFAVLFLDLDRFKIVNDSLGHTMGDQLLVELAQRLELCLRKNDTAARLGGDEFAMILDDIKDTLDAIHIAERVQESLHQPFDLNGQEFFTSASIGIAYSSSGYECPEDILRDADTAMYRAKANGKARYEVFDAEMHQRALQALKLEGDLRRAIERGEIRVQYQPIFSLTSGDVGGFEALARWDHPEHGAIPPDKFIPLAEETGLILALGEAVLRTACRQMKEWQDRWCCAAGQSLTISVNLSGKQFSQPNLVQQIEQVLRETNLDPRSLRLEITESVVMENANTATEMLHQMKELGVQLSIDDFGTGYSSLSCLHRFPFDILKVDRSFVAGMTTDHESACIVEIIMMLSDKLGKQVVAEGIETDEQLEQLKALACEYGQGYLFSRPVEAVVVPGLFFKRASQSNPLTGAALDAEETKLLDEAYAL